MKENKPVSNEKNLNELANTIVRQYFGKDFYYEKGYMPDWIYNAETENDVDEISINVLKGSVFPNSLQLKPIIFYLPKLRKTIAEFLVHKKLPKNFITEAKLSIKVFSKKSTMKCIAILEDTDGKNYMSDEHFELPYNNDFKIFNAQKTNDMEWMNEADNQLNTSEWLGAILRYFWYLGKRKFNTFYNQRELKRNAITGYVFQVVLLALFFYIMITLWS